MKNDRPDSASGNASALTAWLLDETVRLGATSCDAILVESVDISTSQRLRKPEGIERSESKALGLRAFVGSQQAIVSTTDTHKDTLRELAARAVAMAKVAPPDPDSSLAPPAAYARTVPDLDLCDRNEPDTAWLMAQCQEAEEVALNVPGITNSEGASAHYARSNVTLAIHDGITQCFAGHYEGSYFSTSVSVLAGEGTGMERDYEFTSARFREDLRDAAWVGNQAATKALARRNPRKVPTCKVPVVFDPRISRGMLNVLAGAISGSSIARGASFLKNALHTEIFASSIRIIDDPHIRRGFSSKPFDGEGVKNTKQALVENGVLNTWLLDVRTAKKLGMTTTGHASRGIASPPSPSSTNLYMEPGPLTPQALIGEVQNGLYVTETFGMGINTITGDYSQGAAGFWIENGVLTYPVSEITIAGHLSDMFKTATPANDLLFRYGTNAPTLRVGAMTVAGS